MRSIGRLDKLTLETASLLAGPAGAQDSTASARAARPAACSVEGVWELESVTTDGQRQELGGYRQRKLVAHGHYMWIGHDARRDTLPMRTATDSLRAAQIGGGAGPYAVAGDSYTEQLEYFVDPTWVGRSFPAKCRTEGDRWYHDFEITVGGRTQRVNEVWRRLR